MAKQLEREIQKHYLQHLTLHYKENKAGAERMRIDVEHSPMHNGSRITSHPLHIPKCYGDDTIVLFTHIVEIMDSICRKAINRYLIDPNFRELFGYSKQCEELIKMPSGYDCLLPMARYDIFYNEDNGSFYFCEINTDGTSAMNEDWWLDRFNINNPAHQDVLRHYKLQSFPLFEDWVETFRRLFREWLHHKRKVSEGVSFGLGEEEDLSPLSNGRTLASYNSKAENDSLENGGVPTVAIVDFLDKGMVREFEEFARRFQQAGLNAIVADIRDLTYDGEKLRDSNGYVIDAIYRRAVTGDILKDIDSVQPFLNAVRDEKVFLCGHFRTQVVHTKTFFAVLHTPQMQALLGPEEITFIEKHIPYTVNFAKTGIGQKEVGKGKLMGQKDYGQVTGMDKKDNGQIIGIDQNENKPTPIAIGPGGIDIAEVAAHKDDWILKPYDDYASAGIKNGRDCTVEEWTKICLSCYGNGYVAQRYASQYASKNVDFLFGDGEIHDYINTSGLYAYDGRFAGVYSRGGYGNIIASHGNERNMPTYYIAGRK